MAYRFNIFIGCLFFLLYACNDQNTNQKEVNIVSKSDSIIDVSYKASGVDKLENSEISFVFRDRLYTAERKEGQFVLERKFKDSLNVIRDVYTNSKFERYINDQLTEIPDSMAGRYKESVNSVHYFSVLPLGLKDKAVNSKYLDEVSLFDKKYHKIEITFDQEGGGEDYEDVFIYWINQESAYIDYLAYKFNVNGGGLRFREAINERFVSGLRIVDHKNYKPKENSVKLEDLDSLFLADQLELLSLIELENFQFKNQ